MPCNPNRKERLTPLNPVPRGSETNRTGNAARDGYTVTGRRPRSGFFDDIVPAGDADRIEGIVSDFALPDGDYDD